MVFKHKPKLLILASRNNKTIEETIAAIGGSSSTADVKGVGVDLSDLDSVRNAAAEILELTPVLDVLINNAGIMSKYCYHYGRKLADCYDSASRLQDHQTRS